MIKAKPSSTPAPKARPTAPMIHVAPTDPKVYVQNIPAPNVEVQVQPAKACSWVFEIERDKDGSISRVIANPK